MLIRANITPEVGLKVVKQAKIYTIRVVVVVVSSSLCVCAATVCGCQDLNATLVG